MRTHYRRHPDKQNHFRCPDNAHRCPRPEIQAYLTYHNNIYGTGLNEGRLTQEIIEKQSGKINFNQHTIEAINNTLKNINQIATTTGLTGTPGVIIMPLNGATEDNTTVFSGMTEAENIQQAINKAQGK